MKAPHFIQLLLCICLISCAANPRHENPNIDSTLIAQKNTSDTFETGRIINPVSCLSDKNISYALYIPIKNDKQNLAVVYFFDPHGDGSLPLEKYKSLADSYHFILIGSNDSKNGNDWNDAENIWKVLNADVQKRIPFSPDRIYTAGFSGGAKVATLLALQHPEIKGVIADGAALPEIARAGNVGFTFTGIAGNGDMNQSDLISVNNILAKTTTKHRLILFKGKHEWAPETIMNTAFAGFKFDAMRQHLINIDTIFIDDFVRKSENFIQQNLKENNFLEANQVCSLSIKLLDSLTKKVNWFQQKQDAILEDPVFKKQLIAAQNILAKEENIKSGYQNHFAVADTDYWKQTISEVHEKAKLSNAESEMYQRLEAYLSLAFYSISNQLISQQENSQASYFIKLYKDVDPTNSEAWYFSAILNARNKNANATKNDLLRAVSLGFNDKKRLEAQPEFHTNLSPKYLSEIENKMK